MTEIPEWAVAAFARVPIAADLTGVDVPTIEELVASGRVRSVRLKRGLHVRLDDVLNAAEIGGNDRTTTPADGSEPCYDGRAREGPEQCSGPIARGRHSQGSQVPNHASDLPCLGE